MTSSQATLLTLPRDYQEMNKVLQMPFANFYDIDKMAHL
jgi:hypothetical protein